MSNIEEDIKLLKKFNPGDEYTEKIKSAIEHILSELEADKKRIKELEEWKNNRADFQQKYIEVTNLYLNSIPKQKVKEILDRLHISDIESWSTYKVSGDILFDLQELLEDK